MNIMATSNFFKCCADDYYVLHTEEEFDNEIYPIDMEYRINEVVEQLEQEGFYQSNNPYRPYSNLECEEICRKDVEVPFYGNDEDFLCDISICVFVNYGYYSGCNLDFRIVFEDCEYSPCDLVEQFRDAWIYDSGNTDKEKARYALNFYKLFVRDLGKTNKLLEKLCDDVYEVSARFSNGETWYSKKA